MRPVTPRLICIVFCCVKGDRAGLCVVGLDAKALERGMAATPNSVPEISCAIAVVRKVRYFADTSKSNTKFHITVGHTTVMGNVMFFGGKELVDQVQKHEEQSASSDGGSGQLVVSGAAQKYGLHPRCGSADELTF